MALKTAIYMRVSTQDQCVDSQRQELLQFIKKRKDLELSGEYADVISGTREKREQLDRLMVDARQRKIDVVVFFDLSRLTRKGISHAIGLLDEWKQAGVKPICYAYPMLDFTDDSGMGEMMAAMLAWMAEQERKIVKRVKAGLAARKAKGLRLGRVPLQCVSYGSRFSSFLLNEPRLERPGIRPKSPLTARLAGDYFFPRGTQKVPEAAKGRRHSEPVLLVKHDCNPHR
jgi:DNA invertase Pin-like site-specific DNA recombinase